MRLRNILSDTPGHVLDALDQCSIKSSTDFLFNASETIIQRLPHDSPVTYPELCHARERVIKAMAPEGVTADMLLDTTMKKRSTFNSLTTGFPKLDLLFDAMKYGVVEVAGPKSVGKSALALHISTSCLLHYSNAQVHWIDTTGDFLAEKAQASMLSLAKEREDTTVLDRMQMSLAFDIAAVREVLDVIQSSLHPNDTDDAETQKLRVIVIDTITQILGPLLSAESAEGHATMVTFMRQLHNLAETYSLIILVINDSTLSLSKDFHTSNLSKAHWQKKPALGPTFTFLSDATLWLDFASDVLTKTDEENLDDVIVGEVLRSRACPPGAKWPFRITNGLVGPIK